MLGQQSSINQLWGSRLVWRIASAMFLVILFVNALFSAMSLSQYEQDRLYDIREVGLYSIIPVLADASYDQAKPPIGDRLSTRLLQNTPITGLAFYNISFEQVGSIGEALTIAPASDMGGDESLYNKEIGAYEVIFSPGELGISHYIVAQMDARRIATEMDRQISLEIIIVLLLSMLVTLVLILALSRWFLDPVIYLYNRLTTATKNPENPPKADKDFHDKTEIGRAIEAGDILISNNAASIKRIKAMAESEVNRLAYYDTLTGLPNRTSFLKSLKDTIAQQDNHTLDHYAVLAMNVDHFKDINDTMGHAVGDEVLKAFGERLQEAVPDNAIVSRLGADEFAVMLPLTGGSENEAAHHAAQIIEAFRSDAIGVMDENFQVRCSIGYAISPEDADAPEDVLKCADIALNRAKSEGRDRANRYDGKYKEDIQKRFQILRDLRVAMENEDLELFYQPQIDMHTGQLTGAEALIRWWKAGENGVGGGFISPVDFIPVAEQSGLILPLGDWIMRKACETARAWADDGMGELSIAVNVSGHQFLEKDLVHKIERTIVETGIKAHQLEVEVTESVFMEDTEHSIKILKDIQALGVPIAIDDFGTGYSSLSYLQRFPLDKLKIDRAFVRHIDNQHDNLVLTKTIIALCKTMGLKVVAEGVETGPEEEILIREACDVGQGYRYSAPIPDIKFRKFAKDYTGDLSYFGK